jgi:hypothetical protein
MGGVVAAGQAFFEKDGTKPETQKPLIHPRRRRRSNSPPSSVFFAWRIASGPKIAPKENYYKCTPPGLLRQSGDAEDHLLRNLAGKRVEGPFPWRQKPGIGEAFGRLEF